MSHRHSNPSPLRPHQSLPLVRFASCHHVDRARRACSRALLCALFAVLGLLIFSPLQVHAQASWVRSAGGTDSDFGNDVVVDDAGNRYVTGTFEGSADFDEDGTADVEIRLPAAPVERLRDAGWSDHSILDIVLITAYFNFVNRITNALGVEVTTDEATGYNY